MESSKGFERVILLYGKPIPISKDAHQILLNNFDNKRATNNLGILTIQMKKLKGNMREVARINTRVLPPTIEFALEEIPEI
jgi:hypothetical protein